MKIQRDAVVSIDYELQDDAGQTIDSSHQVGPLTYLHGHGQIVPGLASALEGKAAGEDVNVKVGPDEGYGDRDDRKIMQVERARLPENIEPKVGMTLAADGPGGPVPLFVTAVNDDSVTLDGNHPLAGKTLHFNVKVRDVREATSEELEHGHAHGEGGAH